MWLIHIDTWNFPDPQKIIDLVPIDIRPYVVFNISLSINMIAKPVNGRLSSMAMKLQVMVKNVPKPCGAIIQPSSGGFSHFPDMNYADMESSLYNEFSEIIPIS